MLYKYKYVFLCIEAPYFILLNVIDNILFSELIPIVHKNVLGILN